MTHDELLVKHEELLDRIAQAGLGPEGNVMPTHLVLALRAVVEWHRPVEVRFGQPLCKGCDDRCGCYEGDMGQYNTWESCPTIAVIEKELG